MSIRIRDRMKRFTLLFTKIEDNIGTNPNKGVALPIKIVLLTVVFIAVGFGVMYAVKLKKRLRRARDKANSPIPALEVLKYKKDVQAIINHYRKVIEKKQLNSGCTALAMHVIGKVEDVTLDLEQQDAKQYLNSLKIRLESFRAAYQGEPSYKFNCDGSTSTRFSNTLIDAIFKYLQKCNDDLQMAD